MSLLLFALGLVLLYFGGELLVDNAAGLGRRFGLSPLVVGLTIVAFGTSSPELATSMLAVFRNASDLAVGNIVGSNVANLGLVLGVTGLINPVRTKARFLHRDGGFMLFSSALLLWVGADGVVARFEGAVLFVLLVGYLAALFRTRTELEVEQEFSQEYGEPAARTWLAVLGVAAGVALLAGGAELLVRSAIAIAKTLGVSERVIGLTMVALGTSLPELATSIIAALKREGDIVVGNLIGSNVFNVLAVLGITASIRPVALDWAAARSDVWVMLAVSALALVALRTRDRLARPEGGILLAVYLGYIGYL